MNLITTSVDIRLIYETNGTLFFTNIFAHIEENLKQVQIEYDGRWGFLADLLVSLAHQKPTDKDVELNLSPYIKVNHATTYNLMASINFIGMMYAKLNRCVRYLNSELEIYFNNTDNFTLHYENKNEYLQAASSLGWTLLKRATMHGCNKLPPESVIERIECLATQFNVESTDSLAETFIKILVAALDAKILKSKNHKEDYNALYYQHIYEPKTNKEWKAEGQCSTFETRASEYKLFTVREPVRNDDGTHSHYLDSVFDPELSTVIKNQ